MRLINVDSEELEDFSRRQLPPYAIMSHIRSEVNDGKKLGFQEPGSVKITWRRQSRSDVIKSYRERTKEHGIDYVWMDSCCIDQSSSAGLSEATDSIAQRHRGAAIWCVYLENLSQPEQSDITEWLEHIRWSMNIRWFMRWWTLQAYFASPKVLFFDKDWRSVSEKLSGPLFNCLSRVSHACRDDLFRDISHVCDVPAASRLLTLNGNANSPPEAINPTLERSLHTCYISSTIPTTDIKSCHISDECDWTSALRGQDPLPMSKEAQSWSRSMLEIRMAISDHSQIICQSQGNSPMESGRLPEDRGPGAETLTCVETSHFPEGCSGNEDDLGTTSSDSRSISWSEDSAISLRAKENLFKILNELVDSILQMFFQTLVNELWSAVQVRHVDVAASSLMSATDSIATLFTKSQVDTMFTTSVAATEISRWYSQKQDKSQDPIGFSCHFYKMDPERYACCRLIDASNLSSLRGHILRKHRQPPYCPICSKAFGLVSERDQHVILRACAPEASARIEGISDDQAPLIRENETCATEEVEWFRLWGIIFPGYDEPTSAYADKDVDQLCLIFQKFWKSHGKSVLAFLLQDTEMMQWESLHEESNLARIHSSVFTDVVNKCIMFGEGTFVDLQVMGQEIPFGNAGIPSESIDSALPAPADIQVKVVTNQRPEGSKWATSTFVPVKQENFKELTSMTCHNLGSMHALLELDDGVETGSAETSGLKGKGRLTAGGDKSKIMRIPSRITGELPCEFASTLNCEMRFESCQLDAWIDHHMYRHLGGILPEQCACWFCGQAFVAVGGGVDIRANFIARMDHISKHLKLDGCGGSQMSEDQNMMDHLHFCKLLPLPDSSSLAESLRSVRLAKRSRENGRGRKRGAGPERQSPFSDGPFHRRHDESTVSHDNDELFNTEDSVASNTKKRRLLAIGG